MASPQLSDSEIRSKLLQLGQDVGPVTATTRQLYLRKLSSLLEARPSTGTLTPEETYSGSSKTQSVPPSRTNRSPTRRKSPNRSTLSNTPKSTFAEPKTTVLRETYNSYSGSPSFSDGETERSSPNSLGLNSSTRSRSIYGDDEAELDVSLSRPTRSRSNKDNFKVTDISPSKLTSPDLGVGLSDTFKSRLQASGSTSFTSSYTSPRLSTSNQPYVSDFVRKLSANKSVGTISYGRSISSKLLDVKESDDEDTGASQVYTRFTQGGRSSPTMKGRGKPASPSQDSWLPFDSPISTVLLLIFSLFFVVLGVTYVNMHSADTSVSSPTDIFYPLCGEDSSSTPRVNCIRQVDKDLTTRIFNIIYNKLFERLKNSPCSKIGSGPFVMSDGEIQAAVLETDPTLGNWITQQQLPNVKILIAANPKFKLVDITGGIAIVDPELPYYCFILNNLSLAASWFAKIFIVSAFFGGIYFLVRLYLKREASHKDEVYKLANSIIDIVGSTSQGPESYVPISHVRDQIIAPQDRQRLEKLWNDAVDVLHSDSRVRCEQQVVEGEDCLVWRWVASSYNSNKRKTWQGQAFDTMEGSVNSLPNSPTSCLKIRHMFDAALEEGDDWVGTVVDAILEKTRDARILHLAVERQSREGCVYMKCASALDAGKAYRALHGSWFDSKLVTVKYIREARYLERFPESAKCTQPLHPSNQSHQSVK